MHATLDELARSERVSQSYVSRLLRLTLLAPDIVESILDGRQPDRLRLEGLLEGLPQEWDAQRKRLDDPSCELIDSPSRGLPSHTRCSICGVRANV